MIVTFRDAMGIVSIYNVENVQFCDGKAYFTDGNGTDYKMSFYELISITKENEAE